jgi:hypothetical protein
MNTQHTPGPWYIDCQNESAAIGYRAIVDKDGYTVCSPSPMGQANARLIAAAPDLLAALIAFDNAFSHYCEGDPDSDEVSALYQAREAIAKAKGAA